MRKDNNQLASDQQLKSQDHWWLGPSNAFDAWLIKQSSEVQENDLLEQINLYEMESRR